MKRSATRQSTDPTAEPAAPFALEDVTTHAIRKDPLAYRVARERLALGKPPASFSDYWRAGDPLDIAWDDD